jgi:nicotinate-nucleotide adenylyltransferase
MDYKIKTGLMFGSFNPVHNGHLAVADFMKNNSDLQEIWFVISPQNPLKPKSELLDANHRLELLKAAIEGHPGLKISKVEFSMPVPSYTYDTLNLLSANHPEKDFIIIGGTDIFVDFQKWKKSDRLLENFGFYIYNRPGFEPSAAYRNHPAIRFFEAPLMEISSRSIREAIRNGKDTKNLLPEKVWEMIHENRYYDEE